MNYKIINFYNDLYIRSIAEVIPKGKIKNTMTNHGLGSGFYGFINIDRDDENIRIYKNKNNTPKEFIILNPFIIESNDSDFYFFSTMLNDICATIYEKYKSNIDLTIIESELEFFDNYKFDKNIIIKSIYNFLSDYNILMKTKDVDEDYIFMPINYILHELNYDGIYNKNGDRASLGSVKYFFDGSNPARGYLATYKKRCPLKGKLIFKHPNYDLNQ